jgi:putative methionine-R-sulfoxide reductase with GAF domain
MHDPRRLIRNGTLMGFVVALILPAVSASAATMSLERTIRTTPFAGTSVSMRDHEGSAFVPVDNSLWLADDNGDAIFEVNPATGALKRRIPQADFNAASQFGGGPQAGSNRSEDFESLAYDVNSDTLYVFSGPCCTSSMLPTAFRLTRQSGALRVADWQPLASTADYTGAGWNPGDDKIYVGKGQRFRSFNYATAAEGPAFRVAGVSGITGMDFSANGADLFITNGFERLIRIHWGTRTIAEPFRSSVGAISSATEPTHGRAVTRSGTQCSSSQPPDPIPLSGESCCHHSSEPRSASGSFMPCRPSGAASRARPRSSAARRSFASDLLEHRVHGGHTASARRLPEQPRSAHRSRRAIDRGRIRIAEPGRRDGQQARSGVVLLGAYSGEMTALDLAVELRAAAADAGDRRERAARCAATIRRFGSYRWVGIYEVTDDEIAVVGWDGPSPPAHPRFPRTYGLCGAAVASGKPVVVGDVAADPRYLTTHPTTRSEIVVPLSAARQVVGVIDVESDRMDAFDDDDVSLLERCAGAMRALWKTDRGA